MRPAASTPAPAPAAHRFVVVGAGGLGGPLAYALAALPGAALVLCDDDRVELSNLQRQIQFTSADLDRPKVEVLAAELRRRGATGPVELRCERFTPESADALLRGATAVLDGSDSLATKFAVSDAAVARGIPAVIAAISRYTGQVLAVHPAAGGGCYRCLFEAPPEDDDSQSCAQAGVLGAAVAVVAGYAVQHALALARGDFSRAGELLVFDDLVTDARPRPVRFARRADCPACAPAQRACAKELS